MCPILSVKVFQELQRRQGLRRHPQASIAGCPPHQRPFWQFVADMQSLNKPCTAPCAVLAARQPSSRRTWAPAPFTSGVEPSKVCPQGLQGQQEHFLCV